MRKTVWSRVNTNVEQNVRKLSECMGISISEYIRKLILEDLDRRSLFTSKLKELASDAKKPA